MNSLNKPRFKLGEELFVLVYHGEKDGWRVESDRLIKIIGDKYFFYRSPCCVLREKYIFRDLLTAECQCQDWNERKEKPNSMKPISIAGIAPF